MSVSTRNVSVVLSGGLALGSYQAGAYETLLNDNSLRVDWLAGSSVGAVNAALVAGSSRDQQIGVLRQFWFNGNSAPIDLMMPAYPRHALKWLSALRARLLGAAGHFWPRLPDGALSSFRSFYDLAPMRHRLEELIDFSCLNDGPIRLSIAATDIETGELVIFDTRKGDRIGIDHILASCGLLPEFAPVQIGGRLLGDGGLCANAPIEALFDEIGDEDLTFVIDLFARDGIRPNSLEEAVERKNDLMFGNQTFARLQAYCDSGKLGNVLYLSYRPMSDEAGPEKLFDFSAGSLNSRWDAGSADMIEALSRLPLGRSPRLNVIRRNAR